MLGDALNHLRFPEPLWESRFMPESEFYINRLRYSEMLALCKGAGFRADVVGLKRWKTLPTARPKVARQFQDLSEDDIYISNFHVTLSWSKVRPHHHKKKG